MPQGSGHHVSTDCGSHPQRANGVTEKRHLVYTGELAIIFLELRACSMNTCLKTTYKSRWFDLHTFWDVYFIFFNVKIKHNEKILCISQAPKKLPPLSSTKKFPRKKLSSEMWGFAWDGTAQGLTSRYTTCAQLPPHSHMYSTSCILPCWLLSQFNWNFPNGWRTSQVLVPSRICQMLNPRKAQPASTPLAAAAMFIGKHLWTTQICRLSRFQKVTDNFILHLKTWICSSV
jgi:hypothetical protein